MPLRRREPDPQPGAGLLSEHAARANPAARALAAAQAALERGRYAAAAARQEDARLTAGPPVPARMTIALDYRGLRRPAAGAACGGTARDVDGWERGLAVPEPWQVEAIARLTGFPVAFFYQPTAPGPLAGSPLFRCRGGRAGCEALPAGAVDANGVLRRG